MITKYFTLNHPFEEVKVLVRYTDGKMERITRGDGQWLELSSLFRIFTDDSTDSKEITAEEALEVARFLGHPNALSE